MRGSGSSSFHRLRWRKIRIVKSITFSAPCIKRYETDDFPASGTPRFIALALNGERCALQCDHCGTQMLKALYKVQTPEQFRSLASRMADRGCRGMLLTGGCDPDGTIPLPEFSEAAQEAKQRFGFRYAVHTKLITESFADSAVQCGADLVMLDLVGDDESLRTVYHLAGHSVADVRRSLDIGEQRGLRLAPHILIGISHGRVVGERVALEMLRGRDIASLALVVLTPLRGTPMQGVQVDLPAVLDLLTQAREMFPQMRITLGCAKTGGKTQRALEEHALQIGFDAIAYPSEGLVEKARAEGYSVTLTEACCAFDQWLL